MNKGNFFATLKLYLVSRCLTEHSGIADKIRENGNLLLLLIKYRNKNQIYRKSVKHGVFSNLKGQKLAATTPHYIDFKQSFTLAFPEINLAK